MGSIMPARDSEVGARAMLQWAAQGDPGAAKDLLPLVYDELRALARTRLKQVPPGQTLQPTALVHEAYLRIVGCEDPGWDGRGHFFFAAARAMRELVPSAAMRYRPSYFKPPPETLADDGSSSTPSMPAPA